MEAFPQSQAASGWNPVRVVQVTVALLPVAIAIGGAAARVVVPVAVICALGVVRREKLISAPTDVQRRALQRMARVPNVVQAAQAAYTLAGFAAIYHFFSGGQRLVALVTQVVIVLATSAWTRSVFSRNEPPSANRASAIEPPPDPVAGTSQPPPSLG
jgi:hypothetical protein